MNFPILNNRHYPFAYSPPGTANTIPPLFPGGVLIKDRITKDVKAIWHKKFINLGTDSGISGIFIFLNLKNKYNQQNNNSNYNYAES